MSRKVFISLTIFPEILDFVVKKGIFLNINRDLSEQFSRSVSLEPPRIASMAFMQTNFRTEIDNRKRTRETQEILSLSDNLDKTVLLEQLGSIIDTPQKSKHTTK